MKLVNQTDFNDALVRQIIRFVRPPGISNFTVTIHTTKRDPWRGLALVSEKVLCKDGSSFNRLSKDPLITIHVPRGAGHAVPFTKPDQWYGIPQLGYLHSVVFSAEENLVHLLAHELRHLWQARNPRHLWLAIIRRGRKVWGGHMRPIPRARRLRLRHSQDEGMEATRIVKPNRQPDAIATVTY